MQEKDRFSNQLLQLRLEINNINDIYKDSKEIKGFVILIPKYKMLNIPIQVTIFGQSQCLLFDLNQQLQDSNMSDSQKRADSFHIYETQQDFSEKKTEGQKCLQSTQYLSEVFTQSTIIKQKRQKQIFLQGKQTIFYTKGKDKQKIKILQPQIQYKYEFTFFLPNNLPSSVNDKIFPGVHIFVDYKLKVNLQIDEKFFISIENRTKQLKQPKNFSKISLEKGFQILRNPTNSQKQILNNKMIFKYFHDEGSLIDSPFIEDLCCLKYFYTKIIKRSLQYDIYHCQILTTINSFKVMYLTARIFIQPTKDHLNKVKVKQGKFYSTTKPQEQKPNKPEIAKQQLTVSKVVDGKQKQLTLKIQHIRIIMYAEIVGIKKTKIFQKIIVLNRQMYDLCEGQLITELPFNYFTELNQLYEIKFWFEIFPLSELAMQIYGIQEEQQQIFEKNDIKNEFELTMSQLNQKKQKQKKISDGKSKENKKIKKNIQLRIQRQIEKLHQETNPVIL